VLVGDVEKFLDYTIRDISAKHFWQVLELKVMQDHVHLFLHCNPTDTPSNIVKTLKGISDLQLFRQFPSLRQKLWKGVLWSSSYNIGMVGHVSVKTIKNLTRTFCQEDNIIRV
jgi:putative transposase